MSARPLEPWAVAWAESRVGKWLPVSSDQMAHKGGRRGLVVDWKADTVGEGVFFVLDMGTSRTPEYRYVERYHLLPGHKLHPRRSQA